MGHEIGRLRGLGALTLAALALAIAGGCGDPRAEGEPATPEATEASPATASGARGESELDEFDEESFEASDDLDEETPLPVEEMDRPALEEACFRGRQAACDLLGH